MKKKNIKKPKFSSYLIAAMIPALIVAILINMAGHYFANKIVQDSMTNWSSTNPIPYGELNMLADLHFRDRNAEEEKEYQYALSTLNQELCYRDFIGYYTVYDFADKIFSNDISGYAIYDLKPYRLTDDSSFRQKYLDAFGDFQVGSTDYWRAMVAGQIFISFEESDPATELLNMGSKFLRLSIPDEEYSETRVKDIYVDNDKLVFWPGEVEFIDQDGNVKTIDLTPANTEGLEHIVNEIKPDEPYNSNNLDFMATLIIPHSNDGIEDVDLYGIETYAGTETADETDMRSVNELEVRHIKYKVPDLFILFPVQVSVVWALVAAICVLIAFFIARYRYIGAKAMYDMIEYRRKTSNAMAHDLKTPLAIISAYADNMAEEEDPGKLREYSVKMKANVESANRLLEDILDFSRSESGSITVNKEEVSLSALISRSVEQYSGIFSEHGITIKRSGRDLTLKTDKKLLSQAIDNLILNCAKHATEKTTVNIDIMDKDLLIINSTDLETGNVNELLKPFVKGSSSRGDSGSGLGLSIAQSDLELLGYKLTVSLKDQTFTAVVTFFP